MVFESELVALAGQVKDEGDDERSAASTRHDDSSESGTDSSGPPDMVSAASSSSVCGDLDGAYQLNGLVGALASAC